MEFIQFILRNNVCIFHKYYALHVLRENESRLLFIEEFKCIIYIYI